MKSYASQICKTICPCFFRSQKSSYLKKIGDTEDQSFVGEFVENMATKTSNQNYEMSQNHYSFTTGSDSTRKNVKNQTLIEPQEKLLEIEEQGLSKDTYCNCISEDHQYYNILFPKMSQLPTIFTLGVEPEAKVPDTPYGLKVYIKSSVDQKLNIFVYTMVFPTNQAFYEQMQNNFELQKSFDQNIDNYDCKQVIDDATKTIYLAYKKILIISPRDFVYVRYTFKKGNQNWSIASSLPDQQPILGKVRGSILLTATRAIQKDDQLYLSVYSQVDMKMGMKASATKQRGVTEIKKYLDKCYAHIQQQKNSII